jgi:hypothetical protein
MSLLTGWFCDDVKKRMSGQVEISYCPGGRLLNLLNYGQYAKFVKGVEERR